MSIIKRGKVEKGKKCICGAAAKEKIILHGGVHTRQRNIYLCEECIKKLIDTVIPF